MTAANRTLAPFLLLAINALLLSLMAYEVVSLQPPAVQEGRAVVPPPQNPLADVRNSDITRTLDDYGEMVNRPLFNRDRRPLENDEPANSEEDALAFSLLGVVLTPEQQVAIIYSRNQQQPVKVALWGWIDGWRLTALEASTAQLRKGNRSLELALQRTSQHGEKSK